MRILLSSCIHQAAQCVPGAQWLTDAESMPASEMFCILSFHTVDLTDGPPATIFDIFMDWACWKRWAWWKEITVIFLKPLVAFLQNIQQESKCQTPSSLSIKVIESVYKNVKQFLWMWELWTNVSLHFIYKIIFFFWRVTLHRPALHQPLIKFLLKRHHVVTIRHRATPEPFSAQHQAKCLINFYLKWAIKAKFDLN